MWDRLRGGIARALALVGLLLTPLLVAVAAQAAEAAETERLVIATEGAYPPFNYIDEQGRLTGFDVDIGQALCARMQVSCTFVRRDWATIIQGLLDKQYDAIIASMSVTPERQALVAFTDKYYTTPMRIVGHGIADLGDAAQSLRGRRVAAQGSSTAEVYAKEVLGGIADIRIYPTQDEVNRALIAGEVDAIIADSLVAWKFLRGNEGRGFAFVGQPIYRDSDVAIAVRKEDRELRQRFNRAIALIIIDGTYQRINYKYFNFDIY